MQGFTQVKIPGVGTVGPTLQVKLTLQSPDVLSGRRGLLSGLSWRSLCSHDAIMERLPRANTLSPYKEHYF